MRAWLVARYFGPHTLVLAAAPVSAAAGFPTHFLPLSTLFPDPAVAFVPEHGSAVVWRRSYAAEVGYLESFRVLEAAALDLGIDARTVASAIAVMQRGRQHADITTLLDVAEMQHATAHRAVY